MDSWADNHEPDATVDDGSCSYNCPLLWNRTRGGTAVGGCVIFEDDGWQRLAPNGTRIGSGVLAEFPEGHWVVQGRAVAGGTAATPDYERYDVGRAQVHIRDTTTAHFRCLSIRDHRDFSFLHKCGDTRKQGTIENVLLLNNIATVGTLTISCYDTSYLTCANNQARQFAGCLVPSAGENGVSHSDFENNSGISGGAILIYVRDILNPTKYMVEYSRFIKNRAVKGGAINVDTDATAIVRSCHFEGNVAIASGGAIAVQLATITIMLSVFFVNQATSTGAALHIDQPFSAKILDAVFDPFAEGALVVFIGGRLAGCDQHPCDAGQSCSYAKYSLHCTPCPLQQYSARGLQCASCLAGQGPMQNQSGCAQCAGNTFSAFGVCEVCFGRPNEDHTACLECPPHQVADPPELGCRCNNGYYNTTFRSFACMPSTVSDFDTLPQQPQLKSNESDVCVECSALHPCTKSCESGLPVLKPGFALLSPLTVPQYHHRSLAEAPTDPQVVTLFRCPDDEAQSGSDATVCPGGNISEAWKCIAGHTGPLCHICSPGYTRSGTSCESCDGGDGGGKALVWAWMVGLSMVLLTAGIVYCIYMSQARRKTVLLDRGADRIEVKQLFDKADDDQSGAIDKEELNELCQKLIGQKLMDEELEEAMKEMDNDQNGTVEFEEFYGWWHKHGGRALSNFRQKQEVAKMRDLLFAYARVLVQPVKILVGFGQIVGQLEKVLHIELPENIAALVTVFKPLVANIFQSFLPVGCVASLSYFQRWMFKVFVIPAVLIAAAWFWYAGERLLCRATNLQSSERVRSASTRRLRSNLSLVVFVLYPTICNEVFATFNCRHLTPTQVVLMSDYAVDCSSTKYATLEVLAVVLGILFCAGIPITAAVVLSLEARKTGVETAVAEGLEESWGIEKPEADDAVLGIELGKHYGFLLEAFRPGCFAWEPLDMIRKLLMVGVIVLVGRGEPGQLLFATMLAILFLMLHILSWPYKQHADNALKMAIELQILCTVTVGLALKADPTADTTGYDIFLVIMFVVNIPVAFILACAHKIRNAHQLLTQARGGRSTELHAEHPAKSSGSHYRLYLLFKAGLASGDVMKALEDYLERLRQKSVGSMILRIEGRTIGARAPPSNDAATIADGEQDDVYGEGDDPSKQTFFWQQQQLITANALHLAAPEEETTTETKEETNAQPLSLTVADSRSQIHKLVAPVSDANRKKEQILRKMEEAMAKALAKLEGHSSVNIISAPYMKTSAQSTEIVAANPWCFNPDVDFVEFGVMPGIGSAGRLKCWLKIAVIVAEKGGTAFFINHSKYGLLGTQQSGELAIAQMVGCNIQMIDVMYHVKDRTAAAVRKDNDDNPFEKYAGGFEGTFADTATFFGGLVKLVGEPQKNVGEAVRAEHCDVLDGFGASRTELTAGNYGVTFTPENEYLFVSDPDFAEPMSCGIEFESKRAPIAGGLRLPLDIHALSDPTVAVKRIRQHFVKMGWPESAVTETSYMALQMAAIELIAMRLYTGPMFAIYNGVLRSMGSDGTVRFGFDEHLIGLSVQGRFVTTLHCINSGVIKLSRLQPKCRVYRGINGMKLPSTFVHSDAFGVRSGVEYGFMSASMDRSVAERYSKGKNTDSPSLILEMQMGMVNRGAFLGWLSQYPDESEILLPPLTGLEVIDFKTDDDGRLVFTMQLNINMQSMTIEEVQSLRKKQCVELAEVVGRDLASRVPVGDVPRRHAAAQQRQVAIETERDANVFNDNTRFVEETEATLAQLPRPGDEVETIRGLHSETVLALAGSFGSEQLLLSGGQDGAVVVHGPLDSPRTEEFLTEGHDDIPAAVLCLAVLSPLPIATVGLFDGTVVAFGLREGSKRQVLHGHSSAVTALAWAPQPACRLVSGSADGTVLVWQLDGGAADSLLLPANLKQCELIGHTDTIRTVCWLSDNILASGSLDGTVRLWRVEKNRDGNISGEFVQCLERHSGPVTALALSTRQWLSVQVLVSGSADRSICAWDSVSFDLVAEKKQCHDLGVCAIEALPSHQLATASTDTTIKIWQLSLGGAFECLQTLRGHTDAVHALSYIDLKGWLASGGSDKTVRLWRVGEARLMESSPIGATAAKHTCATLLNQITLPTELPHRPQGSASVKPAGPAPKPPRTDPVLSVARSMTPPRTQQAAAGSPVLREPPSLEGLSPRLRNQPDRSWRGVWPSPHTKSPQRPALKPTSGP
jgi:predicted outer membrane repeat protein